MSKGALTIVLMSNRHKQLIACINHYLSYEITIIFPASSLFHYNMVLDRFRSSSNLRVIMPSENPDSILSRLTCAYSHIQTDYFVIASDDDLLLHEGLSRASNFLDSHPEFSHYFGETSMMLFNFPYIPIIEPAYSSGNPRSDNSLINTFNSYRYYPHIYGVSRREVLKTYISLFPSDLTSWTGIWETNYALAVTLHGKSFFSKRDPFLLRLFHKSTRTSRLDYAKPPMLNMRFDDYINLYIDLDVLRGQISSILSPNDSDRLLNVVLADIVGDSVFYDAYPETPSLMPSFLIMFLTSIKSQIVKLVRDPLYIIRFPKFFFSAIRYYHMRLAAGVSVLF